MNSTRTTVTAAVLGLAVSLASGSDTAIQRSTAVTWEELSARPATNNGRSRSILKAPTATLDELESHVTTLAPGEASHPPHRHPQEEVVIVREGTLEVNLSGTTKRVGPGAFVFFASMEEHSARNVGTTPAVYFVVQWKVPGRPTP